ncbi:hypothetical protein LOH54_05775 [Sulfurimonas sp. HSL-3221]|uniref:HTH-like domain-containing protein n=1 Tax=Thiomicrolovo sulfuroxydans TaxID=2894755 RepID=UPI001E33EF43|nr:hypothetical protein [Sulfurimonas sp. HSL-3221]UFS63639.1 hypothetical protein LOH54_05775 [Sulfurimonas sp. HSL-3221]
MDMKLITNIESAVNTASSGDKIATFHQQILLHAKELSSTGIKARDFFNIATTLDKPAYHTEYNKMMALSNKILIEDCNLCTKMTDLSHDTWYRLKFTRTNASQLKLFETTITQNLLFELAKFSEHCTFKQVKAFEAINERVNGNDIEFFVQQPNGKYLFFPMQAKVLYPSNKYEQIPYKNQNTDLINYASKKKGYPLYLLYNYSPQHTSYQHYGCSIVDAHYMKSIFNSINPTFDDLHVHSSKYIYPVASTWQSLICDSIFSKNNSYTNKIIKKVYNNEKYSLNQDEVMEEGEWKEVTLATSAKRADEDVMTRIEIIKKKEDSDFLNQGESGFDIGFAPKYKIIVSNEIDIVDTHE